MTKPGAGSPQWAVVDEGWGRKAVDFATLSEPAQLPRVRRRAPPPRRRRRRPAARRRLRLRPRGRAGPRCAARPARASTPRRGWSRSPGTATPTPTSRRRHARAAVGPDASFDVVTSFRGIWGTTPDGRRRGPPGAACPAAASGSRCGVTSRSRPAPGRWRRSGWPPRRRSRNQAAMVALGRPGAGEELLARYGFVDIERVEVPFVWEFADPEMYARALAVHRAGVRGDPERRRGRLPCSAAVEQARRAASGRGCRCGPRSRVVGYLARKPPHGRRTTHDRAELPRDAGATPTSRQLFDDDIAELGYVMNASRLWAHQPAHAGRAVRPAGSVVAAGGWASASAASW